MNSGLPYLAMASSKASTQKPASSVFDNRHASTLRRLVTTQRLKRDRGLERI